MTSTPTARCAGNVLAYTDTQPLTTTVEYYVRARDAAGNQSPNSNHVTRTGQNTGGANLARGKAIEASSTAFTFVAANANDDSTSTYWESAGFESTLTVELGSNADVSSVVLKLNPDQVWGARSQTLEVLGREQSGTSFSSLNAEGGVGLNGRFGTGTKISNVRIEHANVGVWVGRDYDNIPDLWGPADGLEFTGMRIRDTYADGINFSNGTRNSRVFNSSFRTTGDDALAVWANKYVKDQNCWRPTTTRCRSPARR